MSGFGLYADVNGSPFLYTVFMCHRKGTSFLSEGGLL